MAGPAAGRARCGNVEVVGGISARLESYQPPVINSYLTCSAFSLCSFSLSVSVSVYGGGGVGAGIIRHLTLARCFPMSDVNVLSTLPITIYIHVAQLNNT